MEKNFNVGGAVVVINPTSDGKFEFKQSKMQKFGQKVLEVGLDKTNNKHSISDMNRNTSENELTK